VETVKSCSEPFHRGLSVGVGRPWANVSVFDDFNNFNFDYPLTCSWLVGKGNNDWFITKIPKYSRWWFRKPT